MATVNGALTAKATASAVFAGSVKQTGFPTHALNVKVELLLNTTWTDITRYVLVRDDIVISPFGRTNESSGMDTGSLTLTLKNTDGRFTPDNPSGAYYPYVQLNTRIRVSVSDFSVNHTGYTGYRFWGEVAEWPPQWDVTARDVYCQITASGIWRRLSQRTKTLGSPYTRYNNSLNASYNLVGYWPMEDGQGSNYFATTTASTASNMTISGPPTNVPTLAATALFPGSNALPSLNAAEFDATVSTSSGPSTNQFRYAVMMPSGGDTGRGMSATLSAPAVIARMHTSGTVATVDIGYATPEGGGDLVIRGISSGGGTLFTGHSALNTWGIPMLVLVSLAQSGGNIIWTMNTILPGGAGWNTTVNGTITGTVSDVTSVIFNPGGTFNAACVGQATVYYGNPPFSSTANAVNAWKGENALTRFNRLCTEEGIPYENIGSTSTTLGPQVDDTIVNVLQEIEDTDGGLLYERRNAFGLGYRTMASLQNQAAAVTLDYSAAQVGQPLNPVNDDAMVKNDITLTNYDGYSVRVYLSSGARSLQDPPNGVGTGYEYSRNVNSTSHTQVNNLGLQLLNCGTVSKSRYPTITANLARTTTASLFNTIPSLRQGDFLKVNNMPAIGGASTQKQLVWGWTETINNFAWTLAFNTIPEDPWESGFSPGLTVTGQVPASPTTQTTGAGGTGTVTSAQIAAGGIVGANIANGSITNAQLSSTAGITAGQVSFTASAIGGTNVSIAAIAPASPNVNDLWYDSSNGYVLKQWNGTTWAIYQYGTNAINAGSITTALLAAGAVTATTIASGAVTAAKIAAGTIVAGIVDGTLITGAQFVAYGTTGEILVYAGTPTSGNLVTSVSASAGTDGYGNSYDAGVWIYDSGGQSVGMVPGGGSAASQLALSTGSATPTPPSGAACIYGAASGSVQAVDGTDGKTYSVSARRSIVPAGDQNVTSTTFASWVSSDVAAPSGSARVYRIHGLAFVSPNQTGGKAGFSWIGPAGVSGHVAFVYFVQGGPSTSVANSGALNSGTSTGSVAPTMSSGIEQTVVIDGAFSVPAGTSGTFGLQAACGTSGDTFIIRAYSFVDIMPV